MQVVIVAGGLGTRLRSITGKTPKALAPVNGVPFLVRVLAQLHDDGFRYVHLCLGFGANEILSALKRSDGRSPRLTWTLEDQPAGVGGALKRAVPALEPEFLLLYGDVWPANWASRLTCAHAEGLRSGTMAVAPVAAGTTGNVVVRDNVVLRYSKESANSSGLPPELEDAGLSVLPRWSVEEASLHAAHFEEGVIFRSLIERGHLGAFVLPSPSIHVGTPPAYRRAVQVIGEPSK